MVLSKEHLDKALAADILASIMLKSDTTRNIVAPDGPFDAKMKEIAREDVLPMLQDVANVAGMAESKIAMRSMGNLYFDYLAGKGVEKVVGLGLKPARRLLRRAPLVLNEAGMARYTERAAGQWFSEGFEKELFSLKGRGNPLAWHQPSANLPERATVAELWEKGWRPGYKGLVLEDFTLDDMGDLFYLSMKNGNIEFGLTEELVGGRRVFKLYSGTGNTVFFPQNSKVLAHVHGLDALPDGRWAVRPRPSSLDRDALDAYYRSLLAKDPNAKQPSEWIIWGPGPTERTRYLPRRQ
jgi:hypothetical protein